MPSELPRIDEHDIAVEATAELVWDALAEVVAAGFSGRAGPAVARALGCTYTRTDGPIGSVGSTVTGFRVARAERPGDLLLEGKHRFSRYELGFRITEGPYGRSLLRAETRAAFPGAAGRAYRALVIGTRGHVLAVRRVLRAAKRRAERA